MIGSKRFASERTVDLISILLRDFFDAIIEICFILPCYALFSCTSFDLSEMSLASRTERRKALSSAYSSRKKCMWIAAIFVTDCFYQSLWSDPFTAYCNVLENISTRENFWSTGLFYNLR